MGTIKAADILEIKGRRYCTLWLDGFPEGLRLIDRCLIGGVLFDQVPVHYNFGSAKRTLENPYIGIDIKDIVVSEEWFVGKRVEAVRELP